MSVKRPHVIKLNAFAENDIPESYQVGSSRHFFLEKPRVFTLRLLVLTKTIQ